MSPRTGRPTEDPKTERFEIRLSLVDRIKLDYCCNELNLTKAEVIRNGIDEMYQKAKAQTEK